MPASTKVIFGLTPLENFIQENDFFPGKTKMNIFCHALLVSMLTWVFKAWYNMAGELERVISMFININTIETWAG